jgi:hypothetical protein
MPDRLPTMAARCRLGWPPAALMCSWRFLVTASRPKNVKNRLASMPSAGAPLAMMRAG